MGSFLPLAVVGGSEVQIDLPCGALIRMGADETALRRVLAVLWQMEPRRC